MPYVKTKVACAAFDISKQFLYYQAEQKLLKLDRHYILLSGAGSSRRNYRWDLEALRELWGTTPARRRR